MIVFRSTSQFWIHRLSVLSTRSIDDQRNYIRYRDIALRTLETVTLAMGRITRESIVAHSKLDLWHSVTHTVKPDWQMKETELISRRGISQQHPTSTPHKEIEVTPSASTNHPHHPPKSKANPSSFPEKADATPITLSSHLVFFGLPQYVQLATFTFVRWQ